MAFQAEAPKPIVMRNKELRDLLKKYPDDAFLRIEKTTDYNDLKRSTMRLLEISERLGETNALIAIVVTE